MDNKILNRNINMFQSTLENFKRNQLNSQKLKKEIIYKSINKYQTNLSEEF